MRMQGPPQGLPQTALQALSLPLRKPSRRPPSRGKKQRMALQGRGWFRVLARRGVSQKQKAEQQVIDHTRAFVPPAPFSCHHPSLNPCSLLPSPPPPPPPPPPLPCLFPYSCHQVFLTRFLQMSDSTCAMHSLRCCANHSLAALCSLNPYCVHSLNHRTSFWPCNQAVDSPFTVTGHHAQQVCRYCLLCLAALTRFELTKPNVGWHQSLTTVRSVLFWTTKWLT